MLFNLVYNKCPNVMTVLYTNFSKMLQLIIIIIIF